MKQNDIWASLLEAMLPYGHEFVAALGLPNDEALEVKAAQQFLQALTHGLLSWVTDDPRQPRFQMAYSPLLPFGAPNTDTVYSFAAVDAAGVYRLSGTRGTSLYMNLSMGAFWQLDGKLSRRYGDRSFDSLTLNSDGQFDVIVSRERPSGWTGDWWELPGGVGALGIRQIFYDWANEQDGIVTIERLDLSAPIPPLSVSEIAARIADLPRWVNGEIMLWIRHIAAMRQRVEVNRVHIEDYSDRGGLPGQCYLEGAFALQPGEALLIEVTPPETCTYWALALCDCAFSGIDWINYQAALNGHQVRLDSDGIFRGVIALEDPGVPNWLDPVGNRTGYIQGRWFQASSTPLPQIRKVPLARLRDYLPDDTPHIDAVERDKQLRARRAAAQRRRLC